MRFYFLKFQERGRQSAFISFLLSRLSADYDAGADDANIVIIVVVLCAGEVGLDVILPLA
jgi:hypothetical protein